MIVETIFSTLNADDVPNFAPMGVVWGEKEMIVRPFCDTTTYRNLIATRAGVANVTDNALAFAQSALSDVHLPHVAARRVRGVVLQDACFWCELEVIDVTVGAETNVHGRVGLGARDKEKERADVRCRVAGRGRQRDFLGFNRGKNAVIEAAILATRLHLYRRSDIQSALQRYREIVRKTGGEQEREAMEYIQTYVTRQLLADKS